LDVISDLLCLQVRIDKDRSINEYQPRRKCRPDVLNRTEIWLWSSLPVGVSLRLSQTRPGVKLDINLAPFLPNHKGLDLSQWPAAGVFVLDIEPVRLYG
jgi:hypothetical protein